MPDPGKLARRETLHWPRAVNTVYTRQRTRGTVPSVTVGVASEERLFIRGIGQVLALAPRLPTL